jgi:hypothetical protein
LQPFRDGSSPDSFAGRYQHGKKSKISDNAPSAKAFAWFVVQLRTNPNVFNQVEFRHEGCCGRCGRTLTTPESIDTGFGPECSGKLGIVWETKTRVSRPRTAKRVVADPPSLDLPFDDPIPDMTIAA